MMKVRIPGWQTLRRPMMMGNLIELGDQRETGRSLGDAGHVQRHFGEVG